MMFNSEIERKFNHLLRVIDTIATRSERNQHELASRIDRLEHRIMHDLGGNSRTDHMITHNVAAHRPRQVNLEEMQRMRERMARESQISAYGGWLNNFRQEPERIEEWDD